MDITINIAVDLFEKLLPMVKASYKKSLETGIHPDKTDIAAELGDYVLEVLLPVVAKLSEFEKPEESKQGA